jgi:hypothetical protein
MGYKPGESGNLGGRPKGSYGGRIMALATLDRFLAKSRNKKLLEQALEKEFKADPSRFFKTVIMPLLPRESKLSFDHDGVVQWRSLLGGDGSHGGAEGDGVGVVIEGEGRVLGDGARLSEQSGRED